jgi:beta-lactamase superfamily II metal-dependent hydrolase
MAKKSRKPRKPAEDSTPRLLPPASGATVRMYRIGHGDCFLLAFAGESKDKPVYVLIDCGYKPGSPKYIDTNAKEITAHIRAATGGHIDVAVITHEHQDHVNGITAANFKDITIGETWFAWTEDPKDAIAKRLRKEFNDKLIGLLAARNRLAADGENDQAKKIDEFLAFEFGGDEDQRFNANAAAAMLGAAGGGGSMNKKSMKIFKDIAEKVKYLRPHGAIVKIPGAKSVRVFALGPPRDTELLEDLDPRGEEGFGLAMADTSAGNFFAAAVTGATGGEPPFANRYRIAWAAAPAYKEGDAFFFADHYGQDGVASKPDHAHPNRDDVVPGNPEWRRIDKDWLLSADQLALDMNNYTNNSSLALAFELGKGGKVLLFAADAQRGNWISWAKKDWKDGGETVTAKSLLARTVLYKVGHHGSHNATLHGRAKDPYPNLMWMAEGDLAQEFTAMITAVRAWAETQNGWDHPLKAIKEALLDKASGRVFQTDTDLDRMKMVGDGSQADWDAFQSRTTGDRLYFDYTITP